MKFTKTMTAFAFAGAMMATPALADKIQGNWTTGNGTPAVISKCGASFCIKLTGGKFSGKQIGSVRADGKGNYNGKITDPAANKTYKGKAWFSGKSLKMRGYSGIFFKTQTWKRR